MIPELISTEKVVSTVDPNYVVLVLIYQLKNGTVKFSLYPQGMTIHPELTRVTHKGLNEFRTELFDVGLPLLESMGYTGVFYHTNNEKFIKLLTKNTYHKWQDDLMGMNLYYTTHEELKQLCQQQFQ